jgi:hypothetical protein
MAAAILTVLIAFLCGGSAWLLAGARLSLDPEDQERNDVLNLIAYIGMMLPLAFLVVFFLLAER